MKKLSKYTLRSCQASLSNWLFYKGNNWAKLVFCQQCKSYPEHATPYYRNGVFSKKQ